MTVFTQKRAAVISALFGALLLTACQGTMPQLGAGGTTATGSAGGADAQNANKQLEKCDETLGTVALDEDQTAPWWISARDRKLGSTVPLLRLMIQQSNCFVIVERGRSFNNLERERNLARSGELRGNSSMQQGQMVAADYIIKPEIVFSEKGTGGMRGGIGTGALGAITAIAGSIRANEATTVLLMIDTRSSVQLIAAQGSAKNYDFAGMGFLGGAAGIAGLGGYSNTPEGKVITAAFMDSYNQVVKAARNYRAQTVKGGLGTGGRLGVQGGSTPAGQAVGNPPPKK
ncbi:MAG TPA: CsgG/HfaB family protein [Burkholderiaceae bacterium]|nr:CsgG/HfaB family protein [Burkholderiaceae bacterium]